MARTNSVEYLIKSLGYCCEARFFRIFAKKPSSMIALRLGVTTRAIEKKRKLALLPCPNCSSRLPGS